MRQILWSSDPQLLGLMLSPTNNTPDAEGNWHKVEAKAKEMIVLNLGPVAKVRRREFILGPNADERTAFELWQFLHNEYTATNAQAIQNVFNQIESLKCVDAKSWDSQIDKFNGIAEKLGN